MHLLESREIVVRRIHISFCSLSHFTSADDVVLSCCDGASGDVSSTTIADEWASLLYAIHACMILRIDSSHFLLSE